MGEEKRKARRSLVTGTAARREKEAAVPSREAARTGVVLGSSALYIQLSKTDFVTLQIYQIRSMLALLADCLVGSTTC